MPNYEYKCTQCAHQFEIRQAVGAPAPACPECGAEVEKIFHVPRVIFKGSGFYITDTRAEQQKQRGAANPEATETKPDAKPEAKPDAKSEGKTESTTPASAAKSETAPITSNSSAAK